MLSIWNMICMVAAGLALHVAAGLTSVTNSARAENLQTIYMSPSGTDTAAGDTPTSAVLTLNRVASLIETGPADADVEVRIAGGTYTAPQTIWRSYRPGHTISFMPADYKLGGGLGSFTQRPVFVNKRAAGSNRYIEGPWFYACPGAPGQPLADGGIAGLRFYYLSVQFFANAAISLDGSADPCGGGYHATSPLGEPSQRGLDGNTIFGMNFVNIGNAYTGGSCSDPDFKRCGYGAIVLTESSNNRIANNHFSNLKNTENSYIHAIYLTHKSSHNTFSSNAVSGVSSDPIKLRDSSDYNTFDSNTFGANDFVRSSSPTAAHYLDETGAGECVSYHNRFTNNHLGTYLVGSSGNLPVWNLSPSGDTYAGDAGCPPLPAGQYRLAAVNNTY